MKQNEQLRLDRAKVIHDMAEIATSTKTEDVEKWNRMDGEQKELLARIDRIERSTALETETRVSGAPPAGDPGQPNDAEEHRRIFRNYLRFGSKEEGFVGSMSHADRTILSQKYRSRLAVSLSEQRDMGEAGLGTGAATGAGILVPVGFQHEIEVALKYYGCMLAGDGTGRDGLPRIFPTATGQNLPWPTENDTTIQGEQIGEGQSVTTADLTFGQITFGAWKYSSKLVKVSIELLQDSAFDLEALLIDAFSIRLGRILNNHMTVGVGTTQPNGIVTASVLGATAAGASSNDGSSGANTIGSDDLTNLEHSVDPWYRGNARYMFHDTTLQAIKKVKDKYGRMLWMSSLREGEPDTINGYRFGINNDMDQLQTQATSPTVAKKTAVFGQLNKYMIRRVREMSVIRLEERFAEYGQVAFLAFARYDGNLLDAGTRPVKYLQNNF